MIKLEPKGSEKLRYELNLLTDAAGEPAGWTLTERRADGGHRVFRFSRGGVLTGVQEYARDGIYASHHPGSDGICLQEEIRFDEAGKLSRWSRWDYLPEDGIGWDFYETVYDADGNAVDSEYHGQA